MSKIRWHPDEAARDKLYRKVREHLKTQDSIITYLNTEISQLRRRVAALEQQENDVSPTAAANTLTRMVSGLDQH